MAQNQSTAGTGLFTAAGNTVNTQNADLLSSTTVTEAETTARCSASKL